MDDEFGKNTRTGEFPPFYPFGKIDDFVMGRVIGEHESQFSTTEHPQTVYHILTANGEEYCLPTSTVAMQLYEATKMEIGDYIKMVYKGTTVTKNKRSVKSYTLATIKAEAFEKQFPNNKIPLKAVKKQARAAKQEAKPAAAANAPAVAPASSVVPPGAEPTPSDFTNDPMFAPVNKDYAAMVATGVLNDFQIVQALKAKYNLPMEELKKLLARGKPAPAAAAPAPTSASGVAPEVAEKLKVYFKEVLEFYDQIAKSDLPELLKNGNFAVTPEQALEACKDTLKIDAAGVITKA